MTEPTKTSYLTADDTRDTVNGRRYVEREVPFMAGVRVRMQSLTELEQSQFEASMITRKGGANRKAIENSRRRFLSLVLVDGDGKRTHRPQDLEGADSRLVNWLYRLASEHCGLNEDEAESILGN